MAALYFGLAALFTTAAGCDFFHLLYVYIFLLLLRYQLMFAFCGPHLLQWLFTSKNKQLLLPPCELFLSQAKIVSGEQNPASEPFSLFARTWRRFIHLFVQKKELPPEEPQNFHATSSWHLIPKTQFLLWQSQSCFIFLALNTCHQTKQPSIRGKKKGYLEIGIDVMKGKLTFWFCPK